MKLVISVAVCCVLVLATVFLSLQMLSSDPSTEQLDSDITQVEQMIAETKASQQRFTGGAIANVYEANSAILNATADMLRQKKASVLRRIDLNYTVNGSRYEPSAEKISELEAALIQAQAERAAAQAEAALYSGGLIQSLSLIKVATADLQVAQLQNAILAEKYGFLINVSEHTGKANEPMGQSVVENEAEAL